MAGGEPRIAAILPNGLVLVGAELSPARHRPPRRPYKTPPKQRPFSGHKNGTKNAKAHCRPSPFWFHFCGRKAAAVLGTRAGRRCCAGRRAGGRNLVAVKTKFRTAAASRRCSLIFFATSLRRPLQTFSSGFGHWPASGRPMAGQWPASGLAMAVRMLMASRSRVLGRPVAAERAGMGGSVKTRQNACQYPSVCGSFCANMCQNASVCDSRRLRVCRSAPACGAVLQCVSVYLSVGVSRRQ